MKKRFVLMTYIYDTKTERALLITDEDAASMIVQQLNRPKSEGTLHPLAQVAADEFGYIQ